jgi:hypothetical protein
MKPPRLPPLLWVFPLAITTLACPTRTIPFDDGGPHTDAINDLADSGGSFGGAAGVGTATTGTGGAAGFGAAGAGGIAGVGGVAGTGSVRDGQPCSLANDCTSGTCTPFYVDIDGDGYGAGQAMGFCGTTPPIGYSAQSGDCCDSASNLAIAKLIHPGADFQTTSAGGVCNITWDYDCSGAVESNPQNFVGCAPYPACTAMFADFSESACGTPIDSAKFCAVAGPSCTTSGTGHPAVPIRCK